MTKHQHIVLYIHEKVWGVSNLDCLHTMDWMSGEGHTGVVRCLQVDDHNQPRDVDVNYDDVDVGDDFFLALKRIEWPKLFIQGISSTICVYHPLICFSQTDGSRILSAADDKTIKVSNKFCDKNVRHKFWIHVNLFRCGICQLVEGL